MLNLPEFTWSISCSIVTDHYVLKCLFGYLQAMLFGYLQAVGGRRARMTIENFQNARHFQYTVFIIEPAMFGPGKVFKAEVLRRLKNAILNMTFAYKKASLLIA